METKKQSSIFLGSVITILVVYLIFKYLAPYISMLIVGKDRPLPLPGSLMFIYMVLTFLGLFIFITTSDQKIEQFKEPITRFLNGGQAGLVGMLRMAVLVVVPFLVGWGVYNRTAPSVKPPVMIRVQHPTMPGRFEPMINPMRNPDEAMIKKYSEKYGLANVPVEQAEGVFVEKATAEGRDLFQVNCRPCHGSKADGNGPMAWGFRLRPADFTDPGTIATVVEPFLFWRINEGAFGLPAESSPWDSAMPAWKGEIPEEDMWKIILADYDTANKEPRKPEKSH